VPRYARQTAETLTARLADSSAVRELNVTSAEIESFMAEPGSALEVGRVLYPRFFVRGAGISSAHPWPAYAPRDFPRLGFVLLNARRMNFIFPAREIPAPFPQAADAIVLGCKHADYIEARLVLFPDVGAAFLSAPLAQPCSP